MIPARAILLFVAAVLSLVALRQERGSIARRNYLRIALCFVAVVAFLILRQMFRGD